jgi:two-component system, chemotaxis family, chemotaxis protein CheY
LLSDSFFDFSALLSYSQNVTRSIGSSPALVTVDGMSSITEDKKRILVVDDDLNILKVFKSILEKEGYIVETADTGKEAIKKIKKEKFDVWLIDVRLPDMEGTDLLKVSDSEAIKIVVTGFSSDEVGRRAADYGADDFLVKPVRPEELIATVRERLCTV